MRFAMGQLFLFVALNFVFMGSQENNLKQIVLALVAIVGLAAIVFGLPSLIALFNPQVCTINGVCQHEERLQLLENSIPFFVGIGVIAGAGIYWFMSKRMEEKQKSLHGTAEIVMQFLGREEKAIVKRLVEENGKVLQSEISRIEGIGKLRSHRILQRMKDRGVIEIEKFGKTNIVRLSKNIREGLL